jgi:hypothetical protein
LQTRGKEQEQRQVVRGCSADTGRTEERKSKRESKKESKEKREVNKVNIETC